MRHRTFAVGQHFDLSSLGLPDPNSPAGRHFDWSAVGMPHPNSPAGQTFDYSRHHRWHGLGNTLVDVFMKLPSLGMSGAVSFASEIVGGVSIQAALFKHYVGGSAEPLDLGPIPEKWQVWIVNATKARPGPHDIAGEQAQKAGLDDLSDTLGHFTVVVTEKPGSTSKVYEIKKRGKEQYQFGWGRGIHQGCRVPLRDIDVQWLRLRFHLTPAQEAGWLSSRLMPTRLYGYGHLGYEQFKLQHEKVPGTNRLVWVAYIPWRVAVRLGKPFNVCGRFER
jgi:hypothetical protein